MLMRKILFAISTVATIVPATITATDYSVSGRVTDTEGIPEMYATVRIFNQADSITPIAVAATDTAGLFSHTLADPGRYRLTIASTGKGLFATAFELSDSIKAVDMGEITLTEGDVSLDEVTVTAMRPLVKREIDRLTYDVKADPEAAASNLRDILRKVPMLTVDADGTIRINGQTNFKIYKNGRPNNAYSNNAKELFAAIPASSIKKIEVITAPGVRDDAEGSSTILNIVTDSQTMLKGVMGQVGASYYTAGNRLRADAYITSQIDRVTFNIYGNASRAPRSRGNKGHSLTTTDYLESGNRLTTRQEYISPSVSGFYGIEASWEPDTLRLLTAEASGYSWSLFDCLDKSTTTLTDADGNTLQHYRTDTDKDLTNKSFSFDGAINYQRMTRRKDETITLSYNISASSTDNRYHRTYSELENWQLPYTETRSSSRTYFTEQTLQADWTRPYTSHLTLDLGAKAIFRRNHAISDIDYTGHSKTADDFIHHTTVGAAYADLRGSFGKFMVRGGIRYEYSYLSASFRRREGYDNEQPGFSHRLNDWVPTASVMWQPTDAHTLKGAYQRSISRPGISYLNPTVM
ncbi:MAG: TonB-dependent receptor, partial [Muribaculaceae bacterium]|nr:TonB-dependent receptor [Muribaculaceae bacterium]